MTAVRFDEQGHILISPRQFLAAAKTSPARLVADVLCHGTPALFDTYSLYRTFIHKTAKAINVSPYSIWIRGSAHVGFSIAPRAGKVWIGVNDGSDIDLAIVDPDHYHRLDVEIRGWARTIPPDEFLRAKRLSENRRYYCYRHDDLPSTPTCNQYKSKIAAIAARNDRSITAFFYRDYWALHDRCMKDVRDLVSQNQLGLPRPDRARRAAVWLGDGDLGPELCGEGRTELNLARKDNDHRMEVTNGGLAALGGVGAIQRLWLDSCGVDDVGIAALGNSDQLQFLSLADTLVTSACLQTLTHQFPNLQVLALDNTGVSPQAADAFCATSVLTALSVRRCRWPRVRGLHFRNANNAAVRLTGWT